MAEDFHTERTNTLRNQVNTDGVRLLKTKDGFKAFLKDIEKFPYRSFDDIVLITLQYPDSTFLAPYKTFLYKFNRQVKAHEKAIHTISYAPDFDVITELARDANGSFIEPEWGGRNDSIKHVIVETAKHRDTKVFDISQTIGDEIPNLLTSFKVEDKDMEAFCNALKKTSPVPVYTENFEKRPGWIGTHDWAYDPDNKCLYVRDSLAPKSMAQALISGISKASMPEASAFEVDCASYCVCDRFGLDTKHLDSLFENIDEKIDSRIKTRSGADTLDEFKRNMENNVIHTVANMIDGAEGELRLTKERESMNYEKEAEIFGIPALYTSQILTPEEVPKGMYGYKIIGSHFNEKTDQVGGPYCLTDLNNAKADTNQGGTIIVPSYIALNERGFLRIGKDDLAFVDTGPLKNTMERLTHTDLQGILQNRIICSNEEIMWTDHGSRFALYHANDDVPYKHMASYEISKNNYEVAGEDYHIVYGERANNKETLNDFLNKFKSDSDNRPVDYKGYSLSVGDVIGINQYGRVSFAMVDHDGSLVELPHFAEERYADMFKNDSNASIDSYMENGGLKDRWTIGEKGNSDYLRLCIYTKPAEDGTAGKFEYYTHIRANDNEWQLHRISGKMEMTRDDKSLHDFCANILKSRQTQQSKNTHRRVGQEQNKPEKSDGRGVIEHGVYEHKQKEQMPKMSIFGPNFENSVNR